MTYTFVSACIMWWWFHVLTYTLYIHFEHSQGVLKAWDEPLMERKPKPVDREEFERTHKNYKAGRYTAIKEGSKEIHNMLKEVNKVSNCLHRPCAVLRHS